MFGAANAYARNVVTFGFNQTFEAKREAGEEDAADDIEDFGLDLDEDLLAPDSIRDARADSLLALQEAPVELPTDDPLDPNAPTRLPPSRVINLLSLNTSLVTYDFVRARKEDDRLKGFTTTRLRNQISSDFLRGLQLSVEHDLFDDTQSQNGEQLRVFDPALWICSASSRRPPTPRSRRAFSWSRCSPSRPARRSRRTASASRAKDSNRRCDATRRCSRRACARPVVAC